MSTKASTKFESDLGGITLQGEAHPLSAWFVVILRLVMGGAFLGAGLGKFSIFAGESFNAGGYLMGAEGPLAGVFTAMAANPTFLEFANITVPVTQVPIGVALITGAFVRLAALGGAMQMSMFYLASWDVGGPLGFVNSDLIYLVVFLAVAAFGAGRILGLDKHLEQLEVGGQALVEYPKLRYILG